MAKTTYTSATLADELDTTPRELRKFLRSSLSGVEKVGKGGRYNLEMTATQIKSLTKKFAEWNTATLAAKAARAEDTAAKKLNILTAAVDEACDEAGTDSIGELADEDFDLEDPTDEDIAGLEENIDLEDLDLDA